MGRARLKKVHLHGRHEMPVKGPENAETARLCVMTLLGDPPAASTTSTYVGFSFLSLPVTDFTPTFTHALMLICDDLETSQINERCTNAARLHSIAMPAKFTKLPRKTPAGFRTPPKEGLVE